MIFLTLKLPKREIKGEICMINNHPVQLKAPAMVSILEASLSLDFLYVCLSLLLYQPSLSTPKTSAGKHLGFLLMSCL